MQIHPFVTHRFCRRPFFFVLFLGVAVMAGAMALTFANSGSDGVAALLVTLIPVIGAAICLGLIGMVIRLLLVNFVMPLMYLDDLLCMEGWGRLRQAASGNWGAIILLLLIRCIYFIAFGIVAFIAGCVTCCIGWLPFIHHTLFAPFYVFDRVYSLYALQSMGPGFQFMEFDQGVVPPHLPDEYTGEE